MGFNSGFKGLISSGKWWYVIMTWSTKDIRNSELCGIIEYRACASLNICDEATGRTSWMDLLHGLVSLTPTYFSAIHKENPTRSNSVSKFYFIFIWSSTRFGRHTAHHQESKTALAASGFAYVEACWTCSCWTLTARPRTLHVWKTRGCQWSFRLLMIGGVSPETC